jgi:prepilin-type N-terminal cleavage/methylation domain-containing protein
MRNRRGMSLVELLVTLVIMSLVMGAAMNFFIGQSKTFRRGASDVTMLQNIRFGADLLNQHFRSVGANTTEGQPPIIYADDHVLSFNADYATNTPFDLNAIYYTPLAPSTEVQAIRTSNAITVPGQSTLIYPTFDYEASPGIMSPAEMITFWFAPDTETARPDDYVLYRQVNDAAPEAVVRNILQDTVPFFRFMYLNDTSTSATMDTIAATSLPLTFSTTDTLSQRYISHLRAVIVSYLVTNGLTGAAERTRPMDLVAPFPNMSKRELSTCGNPPVNMSPPTLTTSADSDTVYVAWTADGDEIGGERDVMNYLLWRRQVGDSVWNEPITSTPAGNPPNYSYTDASVPQDSLIPTSWEYAVSAVDCTPSYSAPALSAGSATVRKKQ